MQMQAMNHYGHQRGFGGPPQPQRQVGRRGMNRGGFRGNSRFEHNQNQRNFNQNHQQNQHHGGQRPNNESAQGQQGDKAQQQQQAQPPQQKTVQQPAQPQAAQQSPQQKSVQPAQQKQETPVQKPEQNPTKPQAPESKDKTDNVQVEKQTNKPPNQQRNANNNVGNNKQGGWSQGGPGNRQGGFGNKPFGGPKQGQHAGGPPVQGGQAGPGGPPRNQHPRNRGPQQDAGGKPVQREELMLANKLKDLMGPILDLPPLEQTEMKFNGRSRLYIGNLAGEIAEEDVQKLFASYGETAELFINKEKGFGFIKLDYRNNAEKAKRELDGRNMNGRTLRVRFAPHNSAVRVKNLPPFVSNELLYRAFEIFGKIERAYVKVDDRGKTLGEGVVEYARKPSALAAIRNCTEKCFFLTSSLRPVIVESYEEPDEFDGYPEKNLPKKHPEFLKAREVGPRFSEAASFEHEYGTRWKQLHELHRQKEEALKKELAVEEEKLEAQMEYAKYEHETELLRAQLRQREQDRERQKRSWEQAERAADERREHERVQLQRQEDELAQRMRHQDDELRRRQQENTLFVQAQRLNSMLDRQEQGMFDQQPMEGGFRDQFEMQRGYDDVPQNRGWDGPRGMDDFPNKRRRY